MGRWLFRIGGALALLALVVGLGDIYFYSGWRASHQAIAEPSDEHVSIIRRDDWGVPHVLGRTDADAAFALAYAHAEDDFTTIQEVIAASRGRLGELNGADGAKTDFAWNLLGVRADVEARYASDIAPDARAMVEAYADGLNLYAHEHPEELRLPGLFPATGEDIATYTTLTLPFFFGLDRTMGALVAGEDPPREGADPNERGSNAFAVSPSRSPAGDTQLILNSHQPWNGPVAWYEAHATSLAGLDMMGGLFPGAPLPLSGHNRHLGWANTVNRPDLVDVYKLVLDGDGTHYRFDGAWRPLKSKRIWLHVRIGPFVIPVPKTVYRSVQGPVMVNDNGAFAIRYAGIGDIRGIEQYYRLTKAENFAEWQTAMRMQAIPATNFVYADQTGRIGMFYNARFPARAEGYDWRGVLPGDTSGNVWTHYAPFDADPQLIDPAAGFIENSNNTPCAATAEADNLDCADFSPLFGVEAYQTNRGVRAVELMSAPGDLGSAELLRIKYDTGVSRNGPFAPYFAAIAGLHAEGNSDIADGQALLARWDWNLDGHGPADALAEIIIREIWREAYYGTAFPPVRKTLSDAAAFLREHYGRLDVPLGEMVRLRRGDVDLPLSGGLGVLRAISWETGVEADDEGRFTADVGDSYILHMIWGADGSFRSQSVHQFGAATSRPDSRHYADQAPLFAAMRMKPTYYHRRDLLRHTECRYRPGGPRRRQDGSACRR